VAPAAGPGPAGFRVKFQRPSHGISESEPNGVTSLTQSNSSPSLRVRLTGGPVPGTGSDCQPGAAAGNAAGRAAAAAARPPAAAAAARPPAAAAVAAAGPGCGPGAVTDDSTEFK
jgi:hypothetical protein